MKFNTKEEAINNGKETLSKMQGDGWDLRVDESGFSKGTWYYTIYKKGMIVHMDKNGKFWTSFNNFNDKYAGNTFWSVDDHRVFDDPNKAVEHHLKIAQMFTNKCIKAIVNVSGNFIIDVI